MESLICIDISTQETLKKKNRWEVCVSFAGKSHIYSECAEFRHYHLLIFFNSLWEIVSGFVVLRGKIMGSLRETLVCRLCSCVTRKSHFSSLRLSFLNGEMWLMVPIS